MGIPLEAGWTPPVTLDPTTQTSGSPPFVAANAAGNGVAVWTESNNTTSLTLASMIAYQESWSDPVVLNPLSQFSTSPPIVTMFPSGNAIACWQETFDQAVTFVTQVSTFSGGVWSPALSLDSDTNTQFNPYVACSAAGNAVAVWVETTTSGGDNAVQASVYSGGTWSSGTTLNSATQNAASAPYVAMDSSGNATVVWLENLSGVITLQSASLIGGSWSGSPLTVQTNISSFPFVAMSPSTSTAVAVWVMTSGGNNDMQAATLPLMAPGARRSH